VTILTATAAPKTSPKICLSANHGTPCDAQSRSPPTTILGGSNAFSLGKNRKPELLISTIIQPVDKPEYISTVYLGQGKNGMHRGEYRVITNRG
jgi:hypothetical protein